MTGAQPGGAAAAVSRRGTEVNRGREKCCSCYANGCKCQPGLTGGNPKVECPDRPCPIQHLGQTVSMFGCEEAHGVGRSVREFLLDEGTPMRSSLGRSALGHIVAPRVPSREHEPGQEYLGGPERLFKRMRANQLHPLNARSPNRRKGPDLRLER
jgi:hypothetical protein